MTSIYLVRHAEAEGNAYRRIHGQYNSLITPNGLRQIAALERRFAAVPVDACYASDLYRTCKTATSVYVPKHLSLQTDARLREINLGRWEDQPFGYLEQFEPERMEQFNRDAQHWSVEGSETWPQYTGRMLATLREIAVRHDGQTVAIFTHGCVLRVLQTILLGGQTPPYCDNTAVSHLTYDGAFHIDYLNDTSHLTPDISTFERQKWWRQFGDKRDFNLWFRPCEPDCYEACLRDTPVGLVRLGELDAQTGLILDLRLDEDRRGKRLGEQLIGCAVCELRRAGKSMLRVNLPPDDPAYGYFRYFGFTPTTGGLKRSIAVPQRP